jgi:hypothetical protein
MKTTLFSVLSAAVRIAALLHIVNMFSALVPHFVTPPPGGHGTTPAWILIIGSLISAGAGLLLWLNPGLLVRPAVGRAAHEIIESPLDADDILRIGLCLLGVWFAIRSAGNLLFLFVRARFLGQYGGFDGTIDMLLPDVILEAFTMVLGMGLAFGSRGLAGIFHRLRDRR